MTTKHRKWLRNPAMAAGVLALGAAATAPAPAAITLVVNTDTGNLSLVGEPGDTLASYVVYSASLSHSLLYTGWSADRFGATSVSEGFGTWHAMGTASSTDPAKYNPQQMITLGDGSQATYQLGEMCAIWAGFNTGGLPNASTSKIFTFDATHTTIDLGDHFIVGSVEDLVFGYGTTPGFYNGSDVPGSSVWDSTNSVWKTTNTDGWVFDGIEHTYTVTVTSSYYYNQQYTSTGVTGTVSYVPEPLSLGLLALAGGMGMLARPRRG